MIEDKDRCSGCGHPRRESMDPANQRNYQGDSLRCFACEARENEWNRLQQYGANLAGLRPIADRRD